MTEELIAGIILIGVGLLFSFKYKEISVGAYKMYQALYTEKNLGIMFRICGAFLVLGGLLIIFAK